MLLNSLRSALLSEDDPGVDGPELRVSALLSLLDAVHAVPRVLPDPSGHPSGHMPGCRSGLAPDTLHVRTASLLETAPWHWIAEAVRQAIDDIDTTTSHTTT